MQHFSSLSKCIIAMSSTQCHRNLKVGNWSQSLPVVMEEVSKDDFRTFRGARDMAQWFRVCTAFPEDLSLVHSPSIRDRKSVV